MRFKKLFSKSKPTYIVDVISILSSNNTNFNFAPRLVLQTLRRLARLSHREKIKIIAVLSGEPLNKAPKGKKFDTILVFYSLSKENHSVKLAQVTKSRNAILVTNNTKAEEILGDKAKIIKSATFKKMLDLGCDEETYNRDNFNYLKNKKNKSFRNHDHRRSSSVTKNIEKKDAINELIDLVD